MKAGLILIWLGSLLLPASMFGQLPELPVWEEEFLFPVPRFAGNPDKKVKNVYVEWASDSISLFKKSKRKRFPVGDTNIVAKFSWNQTGEMTGYKMRFPGWGSCEMGREEESRGRLAVIEKHREPGLEGAGYRDSTILEFDVQGRETHSKQYLKTAEEDFFLKVAQKVVLDSDGKVSLIEQARNKQFLCDRGFWDGVYAGIPEYENGLIRRAVIQTPDKKFSLSWAWEWNPDGKLQTQISIIPHEAVCFTHSFEYDSKGRLNYFAAHFDLGSEYRVAGDQFWYFYGKGPLPLGQKMVSYTNGSGWFKYHYEFWDE